MAKLANPAVISADSSSPTTLLAEGDDRRHLLVHYANHDTDDYVSFKLATSDNTTWDNDKAPWSDVVPPGGSGTFFVSFLDSGDNLLALAGAADSIVATVLDET